MGTFLVTQMATSGTLIITFWTPKLKTKKIQNSKDITGTGIIMQRIAHKGMITVMANALN